MEVFDKLVATCEIYVSSTVVGEVKHYRSRRDGNKYIINFWKDYVDTGKLDVLEADASEIAKIHEKLPPFYKEGIHLGELESLCILCGNRHLTFCTIDHTAIRVLPFLDLEENAISLERLLVQSGITVNPLKNTHTEKYFQNNLSKGKELKILNIDF